MVPLAPNSLADVWDDIRRVALALGMPDGGEAAIDGLKARLCAISSRALADRRRPTVACVEWLEPLMTAGNWVPELVEMAGGVNLFGEAGRHSPYLTWEQLVAADPEVIVIMPCGWDPARTGPEMHWLTDRPEWPRLQAVRNGRVHLTDGNQYFNRPGPRLVESLGNRRGDKPIPRRTRARGLRSDAGPQRSCGCWRLAAQELLGPRRIRR